MYIYPFYLSIMLQTRIIFAQYNPNKIYCSFQWMYIVILLLYYDNNKSSIQLWLNIYRFVSIKLILENQKCAHPHRDLKSDSHKRFCNRILTKWGIILGHWESEKDCLNSCRNRSAHHCPSRGSNPRPQDDCSYETEYRSYT